MSSPLAFASVTAVLRNLLDNGVINHNLDSVISNDITVTTIPPDTIPLSGDGAKNQLNLFLHQVTPNQGWRNMSLPSRDSRGQRLSNAPLALDLHYLLTAYGTEELHSEILLGYGMYLMHEMPVLDRKAIRDALGGNTIDSSILPTAYQALSATNLADQLEQLKITPETMNREEMSKLWSAMQANYRPSTAYTVSVVIIEAEKASRTALPVLSRGPVDSATGREAGISATAGLVPPYPTLTDIRPPDKQLGAELGNTITLCGHHLNGTNLEAQFEHPRLDEPILHPLADNINSDEVKINLPTGTAVEAAWPPGVWSVSLTLQPPGETESRTTNSSPMLLAPTLDIGSSTATRNATTKAVTVELHFTPLVRPHQNISLRAGGQEAISSATWTSPTGQLDFEFPDLLAGDQWLCLRIDGVDSLLVNRAVQPPEFNLSQRMEIP